MNSFLKDGNKQHCAGCSACANVCTHLAISMKEDEEGFLYPLIDEDKCIKCNLCVKICPIESDQCNDGKEQHSYVGITNNKYFYQESASIGVCTMLAKNVIEMGGFVYGVELNEKDWNAYHVCVTDGDGLNRIRNSKYLQSNTGDTYKEVKERLKREEFVLYIGTPCQIAGLKSYLRKDYETLFTVDIICHGVFSPKLMKYEVGYWEKLFHCRIHNLRFRSKRVYKYDGGNVNFDLDNGKHIERHASASPTYRCYAYAGDGNNYNLRLSCYECQFRSDKRYGDISVGDPWFIDWENVKNDRIRNYNGAKSIYSANTEKGYNLIQAISGHLLSEELPYNKLFCQPAVMYSQREIPRLRKEIYLNLEKEDYGTLVERLLNCDLEQSHTDFVRRYKKKRRKNLLAKYSGFSMIKRSLRKLYNYYRRCRVGLQWWWLNCIVCYLPSVHLRRWFLKLAGMKMNKNVRLFEGIHVRNAKGITLGDGCSVGTRVLLDGRKGLIVGKSVVFGYECIIWTLNHDYNDVNFITKGGPVTIGDYAWICSRSIILPGITIGEGAVVASGAIVTKDVPPYAIVAGVPAKVVGERERKNYDYGYKTSNEYMHFI